MGHQKKFDYNKPMVFGYDEADEELEYIENYFTENKKSKKDLSDDSSLADYMNDALQQEESCSKDVVITMDEKNALIRAIQFNDNYLTPFNANIKIIKSLYKKGFVEKNNTLNNFYQVTKNVQMLVEIEGIEVLDEIVG